MMVLVGYDTSCCRQRGVCFPNVTQILKKPQQLKTSESWFSLISRTISPLYVSRSAGVWWCTQQMQDVWEWLTKQQQPGSFRLHRLPQLCSRGPYSLHCLRSTPGATQRTLLVRNACTREAFQHQQQFSQPCTRLMPGRCSLFGWKYL